MGVILKFFADNWKAIVSGGALILAAVSITGIFVSDYKDRVFKEYLKTHDKEMAEQLTKEFVKKIDAIQKKYASSDDVQVCVAEVMQLCDISAIPYPVVIRTKYLN